MSETNQTTIPAICSWDNLDFFKSQGRIVLSLLIFEASLTFTCVLVTNKCDPVTFMATFYFLKWPDTF